MASLGWSLAASAGSGAFFAGLGAGRSAVSASLNLGEGDFGGALLDAVSMGGTALKIRAAEIAQGAHFTSGAGQGVFAFAAPKVDRLLKGMNRTAGLVQENQIFPIPLPCPLTLLP